MSKENSKNVSSCKQSFKAVENFLRRVAFNLGNTESKTEVKIISCIPIDVTDLQQRIFQLQNELADFREKAKAPKPCTTCAKRGETTPKRQVLCNECLLDNISILSDFLSGGCSSAQLRPSGSAEPDESRDRIDYLPKTKVTAKNTVFTAKKKVYKKKVKSQLVYCARTNTNTPFTNKFNLTNDLTPMKAKARNKNENLSRSYLADVIKRQYDHRPLANEHSPLSDISSPICRDHVPCSPDLPYLESDACSCFHGQFQNVDKYMSNRHVSNEYATFETVRKFDKNSYYDSKFYDLVPVKEKKIKYGNDIDKHKRREQIKQNVEKYWSESVRPKHRVATPMVVNYCSMSSARNKSATLDNGSPKDKHEVMIKMAPRRFVASTPRRLRDNIDLGHVYVKQVREYKKPNIITITPQTHNVATGPSAAANISARQTVISAATFTDSPGDKTETTLDQIKNMLQTVLTEVKTKSYDEKPLVQPKKDAVVQNGPTRGYEYGASQLLQTYTYSPYNMSPFMASCSPPMSCSNYLYPEHLGTQGIPFQQYPLLIQPQKHLCQNYYRNGNYTRPNTKYAATAATNTDKVQERSKETEQLIKEIYKSMALNMDDSSKDNSFREYTKPKIAENKYVDAVIIESDRESRSIAQAISEIFRNSNLRDSTVTGTTDTTLNSYLDPNKPKSVSIETAKRDYYKTERNYHQKEHSTKYSRDRETKRMTTHHETEEQSEQSDDTVIEDTEDTSTEAEIAPVVEAKKEPAKPTESKKSKSGIFKMMLKIFQPRRRRRRKENGADESEKESESDSDDYQTVYSHKDVDANPKPKKVQTVRSRAHSKVFYSKQPQKKRSRAKSPQKHSRTASMEHEYSKYWEEKVAFHEQHHQRHPSSAKPSPVRDQRNRHAYYQNYEARPLLVQPTTRQAPVRTQVNAPVPRFSTNGNKTRHGDNIETRPKNAGSNYYQDNPNLRNDTNTGPHFVTAKSNGSRKATFAKGWLKTCKPQCAQQWKNLIING